MFDKKISSESHVDPQQSIKNDIYSKAYRLAAADDIDSLSKAIDMFASIPSFRDSAQRMSACQEKLAQLKKERDEKEAKAAKLKAKKARQKAVTILSVIVIIVGVIVGIPLYSKIAHNIDRIKIEIVDMSSVYNPNASPYINGCYYIYFDYKIKNGTRADIDYMEIVTYVEDKDGKSLGQITSSFGGYDSSSMNLEKKDSIVKEIYISENQPDKNNFFSTLYDTDMDNWIFTHKITSVKFSDGKNYFGE